MSSHEAGHGAATWIRSRDINLELINRLSRIAPGGYRRDCKRIHSAINVIFCLRMNVLAAADPQGQIAARRYTKNHPNQRVEVIYVPTLGPLCKAFDWRLEIIEAGGLKRRHCTAVNSSSI